MAAVTDFVFLASKITDDGDYSHEINRCLLLGKKAMKNLDNMLKSRDITLPAKVFIEKAMCFFFFNSHLQMLELDHKESYSLKN